MTDAADPMNQLGRVVSVCVAALVMGVFAVLVVGPAVRTAAAVNKLSKQAVTPSSGTTATLFTFSVLFTGAAGVSASAVVATVTDGSTVLSVPLALVPPGTANVGTWSASSLLPVGSWSVLFEATSDDLVTPHVTKAVANPIVVTVPTPPPPTPQPKPTPVLTPVPTPIPTPIPTPTPTSTPPTPSPTPVATATPSATATASASLSASEPAAGPATPAASIKIPVENLVAVGLLGAVAIVAGSAERRRRRGLAAGSRAVEPVGPNVPTGGAVPPTTSDSGRAPTDDAGEDETVGSIDYQPPLEPRN